LVKKLIYRHPHVFGPRKLRSAAAVLAQWDRLKASEKQGHCAARASALDGIPRHLPALQRGQKLWKKALRARLVELPADASQRAQAQAARAVLPKTRDAMGRLLLELACCCQERGWHAEELLRSEIRRCERALRAVERSAGAGQRSKPRPA